MCASTKEAKAMTAAMTLILVKAMMLCVDLAWKSGSMKIFVSDKRLYTVAVDRLMAICE